MTRLISGRDICNLKPIKPLTLVTDRMHWVRTKLRFGAWCALFALAVQFTISFGHVHAPEIAPLALGSPLSALATYLEQVAPKRKDVLLKRAEELCRQLQSEDK